MSTLKKVKEPPLLAAPSRTVEWWKPTDGEANFMRRALTVTRGEGRTPELLWQVLAMRDLGLKANLTREDERDIREDVNFSDGAKRAVMLHHANQVGLQIGLTDVHRERIMESFWKARADGNGLGLASLHYHMRELGMEQPMTTEDRTMMAEDLERRRKTNREDTPIVRDYLMMLYYMKNLGFQDAVTPVDIRYIEDRIATARKSRQLGEVLELLYYGRHTLPPQTTTEDAKMPPIKRFRR